MAYSNVTPPTLPEYDSETYGFYVLVFNYRLNAEDWYMCHLIYGAWRFQYEEGLGVTNTGTTFTQTYSEGSWTEETQNTETLALNPGVNGNVYQRIYTNANIFNGDEIWLAENSVTPVERQKFPIKDFINGMIMTLCGSAVQWPKREPVAFLYGPDKVRLPKLPEWDKEKYPYARMFYNGSRAHLYVSSTPLLFEPGTSTMTSGGFYNPDASGSYFSYLLILADGVWEPHILVTDYESGQESYAFWSTWPLLWSNYDITTEDGTVYMEASVPVPVYE